MNKMLVSSAVGFAMGMGLMMLPVGRTIRQDVQKGAGKVKEIVQDVQSMHEGQ